MAEREWTTEYFRERLAKERPGWVHASGEVTSNRSRVTVRCPEGHVSEKVADGVFRFECKECVAERVRREMEAEFFEALRREGYEPLERYENRQTPILVRCPNGSEWRVSRGNFMHVSHPLRCPCVKCKPKEKRNLKRRTHEQAATEALEKGFRFDPADYKNVNIHVRGVWVECGHEDEVLPNNLFIGRARCRTCANRKKKTTEQYQAEVEAIAPGTKVLEPYQGSKVPILHCCGTCGHEWRVAPYSFLRGSGCPECARRRQSEMRRGENSQFYNPDKPLETEELDSVWSADVKRNDSHACRYCGSTDNLQSHHLFARNLYPRLSRERLNGVTLCATCHYEKGHPRGFVGDETIYEFIDTIRKDLETAKGDQKERLLNLLAEMERRVPILEAALNESKPERISFWRNAIENITKEENELVTV